MLNSIDFFQAFFGPIRGGGTAFDTLKTLGNSIARQNPNIARNLVENENRILREGRPAPRFGAHNSFEALLAQRVS